MVTFTITRRFRCYIWLRRDRRSQRHYYYTMPGRPHLSQQLRERIVHWATVEQLSAIDIAELAGCSERTVYRVLQQVDESGDIAPNQPTGRPRSLDAEDLAFLSSCVDNHPAIYLDELQEQLLEARQVNVSIATLSRALRRLAFSHKSISRSAVERDEQLRATWKGAYADISKEQFVWLDESSVDDRTNQRTEGWSRLGQACVRRQVFLRGQRYSVLPALTVDGIVALDIFEGSVTKERFISFLENQVVSILSRHYGTLHIYHQPCYHDRPQSSIRIPSHAAW